MKLKSHEQRAVRRAAGPLLQRRLIPALSFEIPLRQGAEFSASPLQRIPSQVNASAASKPKETLFYAVLSVLATAALARILAEHLQVLGNWENFFHFVQQLYS